MADADDKQIEQPGKTRLKKSSISAAWCSLSGNSGQSGSPETVRSDQMKDMHAKLKKEQTWHQRKRGFGRLPENGFGGFELIVDLVASGAGRRLLPDWPAVSGYHRISEDWLN